MNTDTSSMSLTMPQKLSGIAETASTPRALVLSESQYVNVIIRQRMNHIYMPTLTKPNKIIKEKVTEKESPVK